jgi:hypothetical protein
VALQMLVARVSKPIGLSRSVAGNSFIVVRKTSAAPARMPERASGAVMLARTFTGLRPRPRWSF